ncbi:MAG: hypothetical protein DRP08_00090 [Candidatus Aenigmatarchaeota archaeon]|nr:hypothetical protein [Candidatus Aenigmarchaeota archaeon]RLJ05083.1 MAG: hypothetical protein DRP08_00090 [Candidatus Aenigmarchaeota archaeon]
MTTKKRAVIIRFCTKSEKFKSPSERNTFFRGLYGWKQVVIKNTNGKIKRYEYYRRGLLDEVPHIKIDNSVFIVALKEMKRMIDYFNKWSNKVEWNMRKIILEDDNDI